MFNCPKCRAPLPRPNADCTRCGYNHAAAAAAAGTVGTWQPGMPGAPGGAVPLGTMVPPGYTAVALGNGAFQLVPIAGAPQQPQQPQLAAVPQQHQGAPQQPAPFNPGAYSATPPPIEQSNPYMLWLDTIGGLLVQMARNIDAMTKAMLQASAPPPANAPARPDAIITPPPTNT